jgi:hypothetical protein
MENYIIIEPDLPFPIVHYPDTYGAFLGFENEKDIFLCSCARFAIENYIRFRIEFDNRLNSDPERNFILSKSKFPQSIVKELMNIDVNAGKEIIDKIKFQNGICHECNKKTPVKRYCIPMYGGVFEQKYGWYINKQSYEYGVLPVFFKILEDICPDEVFSLLEIGKKEYFEKYNFLNDVDLAMAKSRDIDFQKATRKIRKIIENEVRVKFGFKKVGESWASETLLYQLVSEIFPSEKIYRHYRPVFLDYLELDIYIPNLNIGIEYQGIQHFKPIDHWGGKTSLKEVIQRDKKKKNLCEINNIKLILFDYKEDLSRELIENRIKSVLLQ